MEKSFPLMVAAVCLVLLVRLLLGARRQARLDQSVMRAFHWCRQKVWLMFHWRASRQSAAKVAQDAIDRARQGGHWKGNVYTPKSFRRPRKPH